MLNHFNSYTCKLNMSFKGISKRKCVKEVLKNEKPTKENVCFVIFSIQYFIVFHSICQDSTGKPNHKVILINNRVYTCLLVAKSRLTLCGSMDCSLPGSSVHRILQARILEWIAVPFLHGYFSIAGPNEDIPHVCLMFISWNQKLFILSTWRLKPT